MTGTMTTPATTSPAALTAADRCDRCGAAASVRFTLPGGGELLFCSHHANEHEDRLHGVAITVHDERHAH